MFERFTQETRKVLVLAQEEARLLGHGFIGTEHILLGLRREGDGIAAKALESLDVSLVSLRERVKSTIGDAGTAPSGSPPFTPRAKKVLELALREALQLGHHYIGTEHLLLGLIREGEGVATTVLVDLGVEPSRVRQEVIKLMSDHGTDVPVERREEGGGAPEPRCPQCGVGVSEMVRYRSITARPDRGDDTSGSIVVNVLYCGRCGTPFQMLRSGGPGWPEEVAAPENAASLEGQFQLRCRELVGETRALGFDPNVWVSMINRLGALATAKKLLADRHVLVATPWLVARGRSDLTIEHAIGQERWAELFGEEDRAEAARRLTEAGQGGSATTS
ncbi:MAG: Clp protease N-terminal domain-containing protein [Acidimicrobiales bacterium]